MYVHLQGRRGPDRASIRSADDTLPHLTDPPEFYALVMKHMPKITCLHVVYIKEEKTQAHIHRHMYAQVSSLPEYV